MSAACRDTWIFATVSSSRIVELETHLSVDLLNRGLKSASEFIIVCSDMRWINALPVLNDGGDHDRMYKENAERVLLQSVAASTMSAHLAAAFGYNVWWIIAIGQENSQKAMKPLRGIPGPPSSRNLQGRVKDSLSSESNWQVYKIDF